MKIDELQTIECDFDNLTRAGLTSFSANNFIDT